MLDINGGRIFYVGKDAQNHVTSQTSTGSAMPKKAKRFSKQEWSWLFYDWANSVYATNIMAAIFPIYFSSVAKAQGVSGDQMWGYGTAIATFIIAILAPLLGAVGDYKGMKKKFLTFFMILGVLFTVTMAIADQWQMMLIGYVISYIGFAGANLFYDSFLTDVTTEDRMDKVSATGFAMGYIGGSTIPFLVSIAIVISPFGAANPALAVKIAVVITSVWWALFSLPILLNVHQIHYVQTPKSELIKHTFGNILKTATELFKNKAIFVFVLAYFFYIDGVNTVIHMATAYGSTLGLDKTGMILALLVTQIVAVPCSILFSRFAKRFGSIRMIFFAICMYIFICLVGFYMGFSIEQATVADPGKGAVYASALSVSQTLFWIMAALVGTVQGGIQALSRSYFGKLIPPERSNEFFGFFDIFGKFAAVIGPFLYGLLAGLSGSSAVGILSVSALFIVALIVLISGKKHLSGIQKIQGS